MSDYIVEQVRGYVNSILPEMGLELFDISFRQEGQGWILRVYVDHPESVSLDHCTEVSRELSAYLEVEDVIDHAYNLEVSSPGLERPLRTSEEFLRYVGRDVKVKFHQPKDGQKVFYGVIQGVHDDQSIVLLMENGEQLDFTMEEVNHSRLYLK